MDYSIVIPVFNKAALTRQCLETIRETLDGAGDGEIIVVDNASSDETPGMLREFPWVRVIRNEENRGYAGANNQGAQAARGEFLVLLNNDIVAHRGWLASMLKVAREPNVGIVGARLLFPTGTLQHAGVRIDPIKIGLPAFVAFHDMYGFPGDYPEACGIRDVPVVTGACLLTPRELYLSTGGLDEAYWNGYEDVDYCLRIGERGLRVVYDGEASLTHFESQSGAQRFRKVGWNVARLAHRWNGRVVYDGVGASIARGLLRRTSRVTPGVEGLELLSTPPTTIVCHGEYAKAGALRTMLSANRAPIERIVFASSEEAIEAVRSAMEIRGDRYVAIVDARCDLSPGWLDHLIGQVEFSRNTGAATYAPELELRENVASFSADARCTLLALSKFPQHLRLEAFPTVGGSVADFLVRAIECAAGTRGCSKVLGDVPAVCNDAEFERRHGMALADAISSDPALVERKLRSRKAGRGLVSIVMLSWNAPEYTKMALESIRRYTAGEYEIIIVDNGSRPETVDWLRSLQGVRVIYNSANRGYAGGNNQAIAAAHGDYIVLLNNDVIVTEGWLDGLLAAFDRVPRLGVSAPRSNRIAGDQVTPEAHYENIDAMHEYARKRRERFRGEGYLTDRAIGLCLCIDRRVVEQIGGIDERFGAGNFEDDDFSLRVRAAGYRIFVCDDVFIHHFGSQTFAANKIDWTASMRENWTKFAKKWGYPEAYPENGYPTLQAIRRGFDPSHHYVPLPKPVSQAPVERNFALAFTATVRDERDWNQVGAFVRRYMQAFTADDPILLNISATGSLSASTLGNRVENLLTKLNIDSERAAEVAVSDEEESVTAERIVDVRELSARNPSALRAALEEALR